MTGHITELNIYIFYVPTAMSTTKYAKIMNSKAMSWTFVGITFTYLNGNFVSPLATIIVQND